MNNIQKDRTFGDYIINHKLGSGGMASVYHAVHSPTNQVVALKILHEHYADDLNIRKRLEHEAQIAMRLNHPHIVPVWDYGEIDNRPYLVMPYLAGGSLATLFQQPRSLKHEASLNLLATVATALDYAHSQEVVHRDFKMENILLDENKVPAISDFGIAQSATTTRMTMTGQILGTPQYLAPENIEDNGNLNYKADLYSLGVLAYVLLTGYFPFTAHDAVSLLVKHRSETAPLASWVNSDLPSTVDTVFVRALAKNPKARFPDAQSFVEALDTAFADSPIITTTVHLNAQNPVGATVAAMPAPAMPSRNPLAKTGAFEADNLRRSKVQERNPEGKRRRFLAIAFLLFLLCGATSGVLLFANMNMQGAASAATNLESAQDILIDDGLLTPASPSPSVTASPSPSVTPSPSPSVTPSITPTLHPSMSPSPTFTASPTLTPSPTNTRNPYASPSATLTASRTPTASPQSGSGGGQAPAPSNTRRPTATRTPTATLTATRTPTRVPSNTPLPTATNVPPTAIPPTAIPPTDIPPTDIPPTDIPPTDIPPTDIPPTDPPPPTDEPPTEPPSEEGTDEG